MELVHQCNLGNVFDFIVLNNIGRYGETVSAKLELWNRASHEQLMEQLHGKFYREKQLIVEPEIQDQRVHLVPDRRAKSYEAFYAEQYREPEFGDHKPYMQSWIRRYHARHDDHLKRDFTQVHLRNNVVVLKHQDNHNLEAQVYHRQNAIKLKKHNHSPQEIYVPMYLLSQPFW